jgi:glutamyl-tRNA synthetase
MTERRTYKTRLAPSPTGTLHVGTAHTALFNFLFARHHGGDFVIRVEDTDYERSQKEFEENIIEGLSWLGIESDVPVTRQSERTEYYRSLLEKLVHQGSLFYCSHAAEALEKERQRLMSEGKAPYHHCSERDMNVSSGVLRIKNDTKYPIVFSDIIRGDISFDPTTFGDFVVAKNLDSPLYNFAVAVDDHDMAITHVIRGEDHIANTPKQMMIQLLLGIEPPLYAHIPLLLGTDRSKLSKRHGATSVSEYRDQGYLSDALFNFLALLGWNPGTDQEVFSLEELISAFSLERVQKSGAIFDTAKLDWMNGEYIRKKSPESLALLAEPYIKDFFQDQKPKIKIKNKNDYIESVIELEQPRLKKLSELSEKIDYFFKEPEYDKALLLWKSMNEKDVIRSLAHAQKVIEDITESDWNKENIEAVFLKEGESYKNRGELLWPLRVALSGKKASPGPFDILAILGKERAIVRIKTGIDLLS